MKLTKTQQKKLHRKLRVNASAENVFVSQFINAFKSAVGKQIQDAKSIEEVDKIIEKIDLKRISRYIKQLSKNVLKKNNTGFSGVIDALLHGIDSMKKSRKYSKDFTASLGKLIKDKKIYNPLLEKFEANMNLIKNLPETIYKEIYNDLKKGYLKGEGFRGTEVEKLLYERLGNRARLITRTESSKVNTALTEVRARSIGVNAYMWSSSDDARVRSTHRLINNVMFFWNDPPKFLYKAKSGKVSEMRGHAGETPNCRCVVLPIFELEDIQFPVRVAEHISVMEKYVGVNRYETYISSGNIVRLTKQQFLQRYGSKFILEG